MNDPPLVMIGAWIPNGALPKIMAEFPGFDFLDARDPAVLEPHLGRVVIMYGPFPLNRLKEAVSLRWIQLNTAGVTSEMCRAAQERGLTVTNLAGLYGPSIAEHTLAMILVLARNLHTVLRNQQQARWDREVARTMWDLRGRTLGILGLGNIGRSIARLARAFGMHIVGCQWPEGDLVPEVDHLYREDDLKTMLGEADVVVVTVPLTPRTEGMLGPAEFAAMKRGVLFLNVSRGPVVQEEALLGALRSGQVGGAGLDVFAIEPLPQQHPFWTMPQVIVSPHFSGENVNLSSLPLQRFQRNLHNWLSHRPLEGLVNAALGF